MPTAEVPEVDEYQADSEPLYNTVYESLYK